MSSSLAIELVDVCKTFGQVAANRKVHLQVEQGTIHGIIGENGAGKSTLMNILYGFYQADGGQIRVHGREVTMTSPKDAIEIGIGMVHQHFMLVENLTVLENIILGTEQSVLIRQNFKQARQVLDEIEKQYGLSVDLETKVENLSVGAQQQVEILKTLYRQSKILILDEPTAVLTPQESEKLFKILEALAKGDVTVILITHKLKEIMAITNHVTVMRAGEVVMNSPTSSTNIEDLATVMIGRKPHTERQHKQNIAKTLKFHVEGLSYSDKRGVQLLKNINLKVHTGEIVGIAGVSGNGQSELLEVLTGMTPFGSGSLTLHHQDGSTTTITPQQPMTPKLMRQLKVAHLPEDRLKTAIIKDFWATENAILGYQDNKIYNQGLLMNQASILEDTKNKMQNFDVRPSNPCLLMKHFSGGNQQKLVIARELSAKPDVIIIGQPTRGVDIGAIEFIHDQMIQMRNSGVAIILVSVELDEIKALSDRIVVMCQGEITGEVSAQDADEQTLGLMMANALKRKETA